MQTEHRHWPPIFIRTRAAVRTVSCSWFTLQTHMLYISFYGPFRHLRKSSNALLFGGTFWDCACRIMNRWISERQISTFSPASHVKWLVVLPANQTSSSTCIRNDRPWFPLTLSLCSHANETIKLGSKELLIPVPRNERQEGWKVKGHPYYCRT